MTGILLAGGMSRRMGREKGLLRIGDRHLYQYPLKVLESLCDEILISTCRDLPIVEKHPRVCDEVAGLGPIGGICTCLKRSSADTCIVLSYDLPLVNKELVRYLLEESRGFDALFPVIGPGKPEPLCAVFRKSTVPALEKLIGTGDYAVHRVIPLTNSRVLPIGEDLPFYRPNLFLNINSQEELEALPPNFGRTNS